MSDTNTPSQPIEALPIIETRIHEVGHESLYNAETNAMLEANFKESARKRHVEDQQAGEIDEILREESKMTELERDDPEEFIKQLGAMATVRNNAEGAKFATKVESRTYKQVAEGVISRDDNVSQEVSKPKQEFDPLNPKTRFGKFVSRALFGETAPSSKKFNPEKVLARQKRTVRMAGGPLTSRTLQKYRDDN